MDFCCSIAGLRFDILEFMVGWELRFSNDAKHSPWATFGLAGWSVFVVVLPVLALGFRFGKFVVFYWWTEV